MEAKWNELSGCLQEFPHGLGLVGRQIVQDDVDLTTEARKAPRQTSLMYNAACSGSKMEILAYQVFHGIKMKITPERRMQDAGRQRSTYQAVSESPD